MINKLRQIFKKKTEGDSTKNQLPVFIFLALLISVSLSGWSLWLYNESGAAQLDLSRPSYQEAREKAKKQEEQEEQEKEEQNNNDFSAEGDINEKVITEFKVIYKERQKKIEADAFKDNPLSDKTLNISE